MKFELSGKKWGEASAGAVCGMLFFAFFKGLFIYTLSDFYAFSVALLCIILLHNILEYEQKN